MRSRAQDLLSLARWVVGLLTLLIAAYLLALGLYSMAWMSPVVGILAPVALALLVSAPVLFLTSRRGSAARRSPRR